MRVSIPYYGQYIEIDLDRYIITRHSDNFITLALVPSGATIYLYDDAVRDFDRQVDSNFKEYANGSQS